MRNFRLNSIFKFSSVEQESKHHKLVQCNLSVVARLYANILSKLFLRLVVYIFYDFTTVRASCEEERKGQ